MTNDKDGVCPCWGTDKEVEQLRAELETAQHQNAQLAAALAEIARGQGAFSRDPLTHASNTIEHLVDTAKVALQGNSTALRDLLLPIQADAEAIANLSCTTCLSFEAQSFKATEIAQQILTRLRELCEKGTK